MEIKDSLALIYTVQSKDLASDLPIDKDDNFPEVFATSRMIALMELAAARLMKPMLQSDELSVGVNVNVNHLAATPNNQEIKAVATYIGMAGKLYQFEVELHDKGGIAGSGTHTRAIVKTERLVQGAIARVNKP
ncbi:thioesterase family protein [Thalassotalea euphylliae]|uniref:Thioesterase n=1 Tax=Thalassotalea euphylliae TaxID=1655234 RepID=A0A3E0UFH2_9GAMM|nr:thioesterase [Thalassotalea euphylliae]REL35353.1 thioesterase [Thalassotalea euphylliae]